jgi:hypothetical protein
VVQDLVAAACQLDVQAWMAGHSQEVSLLVKGGGGHMHAVNNLQGKRNSASSQREQLPLYMSLFFFLVFGEHLDRNG